MHANILSELNAKYCSGELVPDPGQTTVAQELQTLADELRTYRPAWRWPLAPLRKTPKGIYIHGPVGRGKSMMMDLFFECAPTERKWRVHFHDFMAEVHSRRKTFAKQADPLPKIARSIADEAWLLCFDEFQVEDIADAMILARFFTALFELGVIVVATSNQRPGDLYTDGLHRERFLPFTELLENKMNVVSISGDTDYRRGRIKGRTLYHTPLGLHAEKSVDSLFNELTDSSPAEPSILEIEGRELRVEAAHGVARFDFDALCGRPLGAADYKALANVFWTLILENVPEMTAERNDAARRFSTLIDVLYENHIRFICSAATDPDQLFIGLYNAASFARTVSRLEEMRSEDYFEKSQAAA